MGGATAILQIKETLFDGFKVRLDSGEVVWIDRKRVEDYLPHALVVPEWYKKRIMQKLGRDDEEEPPF